jgi:hypothetical protein
MNVGELPNRPSRMNFRAAKRKAKFVRPLPQYRYITCRHTATSFCVPDKWCQFILIVDDNMN